MKRIFVLLGCSLVLALGVALADTPEDQFVDIYNAIQQADTLADSGHGETALRRYQEAQAGLKQLQAAHPTWNEKVIKYRLNYVSEKIAPLAAKFPNLPPTPAKAPMKAEAAGGVDKQMSLLNDEIIRLRAEKSQVEAKLKEALSAKPASVDPVEMAKATEKITSLEKENSLLKVSREQDQKKLAAMVAPQAAEQAQKELAKVQRTLAAQAEALNAITAENKNLQKRQTEKPELGALRSENSALKRQVGDLNKKVATVAKVEDLNQQLTQSKNELKAQQARNEALNKETKKLEVLLKDSSFQPGTPSPRVSTMEKELAVAQKEKAALAKEKDTLEARLREKSSTPAKPAADAPKVKKLEAERAELEKQLESARSKLAEAKSMAQGSESTVASLQKEKAALAKDKASLEAKLRTTSPVPNTPAGESTALKQLEQERASLQAENAALSREKAKLEMLLTDPALQVGTTPVKGSALERELAVAKKSAKASDATVAALQKEKADLERDNQSLESKLKAAQAAKKGKSKPDALSEELVVTRARLETLEAKSVPYTAEELALFKSPAPALVAKLDTTSAKKSTKKLSATAEPLIKEAQSAFAAGRYDEAEQKYLQVLRQDEANVFTLANLAAIQIEQNRPADAEANLNKALALEPDDVFSIYKLGYLKFRQQKFDDALNSLSRAAQLDPKNAEIQNYLGITLSEKGQRAAAESALRNSIRLAPRNPDAHHNLAVIYATQKPPALALARWHYQKAVDTGHAKNPDLEKILDGN